MAERPRWTCRTSPPVGWTGTSSADWQPWDLAAGSLLVTEAGGRFGRAEPDGGPRGPLVVAATPAIFDRLAEAAGLV